MQEFQMKEEQYEKINELEEVINLKGEEYKMNLESLSRMLEARQEECDSLKEKLKEYESKE